MYGYIYLWINLITDGKYVGKHKYPKLEWDPDYLTSGELIQKKIEEYGIENFKRVMLDVCDTLEELNSAEKYWIYELETYAGWNKGGYNLTLGGDGFSGKHTNETKQLIGELSSLHYQEDQTLGKRVGDGLKKYYKENPDKRQENNEAIKAALNTTESKEKRSIIHQERWNDDEKKQIQSTKIIETWKNEEIRQKRSNGIKLSMKNPEYTKKLSKRVTTQNTGRKWMHKDNCRKFVKPEEIDSYLQLGYAFGMK